MIEVILAIFLGSGLFAVLMTFSYFIYKQARTL